MPHCSIVAIALCIGVSTDVNDTSLDITRLCRFHSNKWSTMLIRLYFTVKKCEGLSWIRLFLLLRQSVKLELQRTAGVKHMTDGEGSSTERKRSTMKRSLWNIWQK